MKKDEILEAARSIIAEEGYDRLTTGTLAARLGIRKSSLYYYYPSLSAIIEDLYEDFRKRLRTLGFTIDFSASSEEVIGATIRHYRAIWSDETISEYFSLMNQRKEIDEAAYELSISLQLMIEAQTSAVIENLLERGKLHFPDSRLLSALFASALRTRLEEEERREEDGSFTESFCSAFK